MLKFTAIKCLNFHTSRLIRLYQTEEVRVRFAPSPTGFLHFGGLRTALYNFLFAKSKGGKFLLRIEDTDQSRVIETAQEQLQKDLNWAGIYLDEGPNIGGNYGPYVQSHRLKIYREQVKVLLKNNSAYYCFCTEKRLELLRSQAMRSRQVPKYDNRCRYLSKEEVHQKLDLNEPYCIRFKLTSGSETFNDLIYGSISYDISLTEGDPIIIKSDGFPTYHFANIVDDHLMKITHVLRGVEWQISTTKHLMLYKAFDWNPPAYGHLPLLLNSDGSKLSKRQGDIQILNYRQNGMLPLALVNFILHSGGGFLKDQEIGLSPKCYTMDELAEQFDINKIKTHSGRLMSERLPEFNRLELGRQLNNEADLKILLFQVKNLVKAKFPDKVADDSLRLDEQYIKTILIWATNRINYLNDLVSKQLLFLWTIPTDYSRLDLKDVNIVKDLEEKLNNQERIDKENLNIFFRSFAKQNSIRFDKLMKSLRFILSGLDEGPSVAEMIEILGKENTSARLQIYIKKHNT